MQQSNTESPGYATGAILESVEHSEEPAVAFAFALAFLSVIPEGNLLLSFACDRV
jgi:hypothetical protein